MEMHIDIDVSGLVNGFSACQRRVNFLEPAHREIGALLQAATLDNFDTSGNAEGPWPSLAESTLIARAKNPTGKADTSVAGGGSYKWLTKRGKVTKGAARVISSAKPLIWSKALYRSIRFDATQDYVDVGTPMIKGRGLFFGLSKMRVPARNPFKFRPGLFQAIRRIYVRHIFGTLVQ